MLKWLSWRQSKVNKSQVSTSSHLSEFCWEESGKRRRGCGERERAVDKARLADHMQSEVAAFEVLLKYSVQSSRFVFYFLNSFCVL